MKNYWLFWHLGFLYKSEIRFFIWHVESENSANPSIIISRTETSSSRFPKCMSEVRRSNSWGFQKKSWWQWTKRLSRSVVSNNNSSRWETTDFNEDKEIPEAEETTATTLVEVVISDNLRIKIRTRISDNNAEVTAATIITTVDTKEIDINLGLYCSFRSPFAKCEIQSNKYLCWVVWERESGIWGCLE